MGLTLSTWDPMFTASRDTHLNMGLSSRRLTCVQSHLLLFISLRSCSICIGMLTTPPSPLLHFPGPWNGISVVLECRSSQKCVIKVVGDTFAEVDFQMKEGTKQVSLSDLLKEFYPGDFIEVMGGRFQGQSRWVEGSWSNAVHTAMESSLDDATEICNIMVGPFFNSQPLN